jgi:5-methylcytosine-specific restriction protein B
VVELTSSYRQWGHAALRALVALDGTATPSKIEAYVRELAKEALTDLQWARVIKGKYLRWAKVELKRLGLVTGMGTWELTPEGREYITSRANETLTFPEVAPLDPEEAGQLRAPLETVPATDFQGYVIPILRELAKSSLTKKELFARLEERLDALLLPGDSRIMPDGRPVWEYRASWTLTNLKKSSDIRNPQIGTWEITDVGRLRLERDDGAFDIRSSQDSKAKVRAQWTPGTTSPATSSPPPAWPPAAWSHLEERFDDALLRAFVARVRPDLGPTPDLRSGSIPRNVIFYGPPGTGKTFVARAIATTLTGAHEPDPNGPWSIVQFHPSYAYEDFIQGLRPALEERELRYQVRKGPFLQICEAAERDPDRFFVLVIDEINRGDPARIFGELLYALEYRDEAVDLPLGGQLRVPPNLIVLGTMNSVDRSVALVDYALRRRFTFIRVDPDSDAIRNARDDDPDGAALAATVLDDFNEWLVGKLDREHAIGHSFFLSPACTRIDDDALERIWRHDIRPLLEEYFFGQSKLLAEAREVWMRAVAEASEVEAEAVAQ